jgi:hypothetical protein
LEVLSAETVGEESRDEGITQHERSRLNAPALVVATTSAAVVRRTCIVVCVFVCERGGREVSGQWVRTWGVNVENDGG